MSEYLLESGQIELGLVQDRTGSGLLGLTPKKEFAPEPEPVQQPPPVQQSQPPPPQQHQRQKQTYQSDIQGIVYHKVIFQIIFMVLFPIGKSWKTHPFLDDFSRYWSGLCHGNLSIRVILTKT